MTESLKIERYNPVDDMQSDEEVIEYLMDCYKEDCEGLTLARAMAFSMESLGQARTAKLMVLAGFKLGQETQKRNSSTGYSTAATPRLAI